MPRATVVRPIAALFTCGLLVAAASGPPTDYDLNLARLRSMPQAERERLAAALARYDALPEDRREAIRNLDEAIRNLDPDSRTDHLATLRRYALWFNSLSAKDQERVRSAPDDSARAIVIDKLRSKDAPPGLLAIGDHSVPIGDLGLVAPIEAGNLVRIWMTLSDAEKKKIDAVPARLKQVQDLMRIGRFAQIPVKTMPPTEEEAIQKRLELSPLVKAVNSQAKARQGKAEDLAIGAIAKKKGMAAPGLFRPLHHLVESVHFLQNPPRPVASEDLVRFEAALPSWMRDSIDPLPPAEARRRLTIVYREVYPHPLEMPRPKAEELKKTEPKRAEAAPVSGGGEAATVTPF